MRLSSALTADEDDEDDDDDDEDEGDDDHEKQWREKVASLRQTGA